MPGVKGSGGPVPKRSDQRRRVNKPPIIEQSLVAGGAPVIPEADPAWGAMAAEWYASLPVSGQSVLYSQADWVQAKVLAGILDRLLGQEEINAALFGQWLRGSAELMTTEGARRRLRIELARANVDEEAKPDVSELDSYRRRLRSG